MSSKAELVDYIAEQCSGAGNVTARKMFGEYGIYCDGKIFGLICDDRLFIKITEKGKKLMPDLEKGAPYKGAKEHFIFTEIDEKELLSEFVRATCEDLPMPKPKKKKGV